MSKEATTSVVVRVTIEPVEAEEVAALIAVKIVWKPMKVVVITRIEPAPGT